MINAIILRFIFSSRGRYIDTKDQNSTHRKKDPQRFEILIRDVGQISYTIIFRGEKCRSKGCMSVIIMQEREANEYLYMYFSTSLKSNTDGDFDQIGK